MSSGADCGEVLAWRRTGRGGHRTQCARRVSLRRGDSISREGARCPRGEATGRFPLSARDAALYADVMDGVLRF